MQLERNDFERYEDIDLASLLKVVWVGRWTMILITAVAAMLSVIYALSLPNIYRSEALVTTVGSTSIGSPGLGGLGGLAGLAGVSFGDDGVDDQTLGLAVLKSRAFLSDFIVRRDILVPLMALESWSNGKVIINSEVYDEEKAAWVDKKPNLQKAYQALASKVSASIQSGTGLIKISVTSQSPELAQQWTSWLIEDLNYSMRTEEISEAEKSIAYLEKRVDETASLDMRAVFFSLIQKQSETIMLASVKDDYLFKIVDPAVIPEVKSSPNRALICVLGTVFGGLLSLLFVFSQHLYRENQG